MSDEVADAAARVLTASMEAMQYLVFGIIPYVDTSKTSTDTVPMPTDTATWAERLRGAGLRVTAPRLAVLDALADTSGHPGAGRIAEAARVRLGTLSTQAVYNVLHTLVAAGLIRRIEPAGSPARYETRVADNHHHIVCRSCAATTDVECAVGAAPCLDPSSTNGFLLDEAEVTFWGLCPRCREDGADDGAAHVGPAERVVHAKGGGAHGVVEVTADVT